jgi:hypothetical protein
VLGLVWLMRFFKERMASFGGTFLERMTSEISRLREISSLWRGAWRLVQGADEAGEEYEDIGRAYKLLLVAFSIC